MHTRDEAARLAHGLAGKMLWGQGCIAILHRCSQTCGTAQTSSASTFGVSMQDLQRLYRRGLKVRPPRCEARNQHRRSARTVFVVRDKRYPDPGDNVASSGVASRRDAWNGMVGVRAASTRLQDDVVALELWFIGTDGVDHRVEIPLAAVKHLPLPFGPNCGVEAFQPEGRPHVR